MAEVSLRVDGPVATVTLEAPRRRNALTPGMARELAAQQLGVHPGGGHLHLITRTAGQEAAAARAVLGQEVSGTWAARLGLAREAVDDADVERRCAELAGAVGSGPRLARELVASLRLEADLDGGPLDLAVRVERAPQMLSFQRRAAAGARGSVHPSTVAAATS